MLGHLWGGIFGSAIKEHKQQLTVLGINPLFPVLNISASCLNEYCGFFLFFKCLRATFNFNLLDLVTMSHLYNFNYFFWLSGYI